MKKSLLLFIYIIAMVFTSYPQVEFSGIAKNYNDTIFYIREAEGFANFTRAWRDNKIKVAIDKNGHFKTIIPETAINTWYIKTEKGNQLFDLIKGKGVQVIADFSKPKPLCAIGSNADDFNFISYAIDSINKYYSYNKMDDKVQNIPIDSVLLYRKNLAYFKSNLLNNYTRTHQISDVYYKWLNSRYIYEPYERTLVENIKNKDSVNEMTLHLLMENSTSDEYAALNTVEYNDLIDFYIRSEYKQINKEAFSIEGYFDFAANLNYITGNTKDVFLSRLMYRVRTLPDSQYIPIFKKYDKIVSNKEMKQLVIDARSDYKNPTTPETADFTRPDSIEEIFKKYKGNVIYIDFWASWCIPCRSEMPNAAVLKNKLKGRKIIFLYFGYNDKEKAWVKACNQLSIEGEHYLLTEKMVKEADEIFGIHGIPHYAIIDKEGNIVNKQADKPNEVYQQLLTQIEK